MKFFDGENKYGAIVQFKEILRFGLVGVSNTVGYWIISAVITGWLNAKVSKAYLAGNTVAFLVSVAWSFFWNRRYVFHQYSKGNELWSSLLKTYATYSFTGIALYNIFSWLWIDVVGLSYVIAPMLNAIIGFPVNYVINKKWTFRSKEDGNTERKSEG